MFQKCSLGFPKNAFFSFLNAQKIKKCSYFQKRFQFLKRCSAFTKMFIFLKSRFQEMFTIFKNCLEFEILLVFSKNVQSVKKLYMFLKKNHNFQNFFENFKMCSVSKTIIVHIFKICARIFKNCSRFPKYFWL